MIEKNNTGVGVWMRVAVLMLLAAAVAASLPALSSDSDADQSSVELTAVYADGMVHVEGTAPSWVSSMRFEVYEGGVQVTRAFAIVSNQSFSADIRCEIGDSATLKAIATSVGTTSQTSFWPIEVPHDIEVTSVAIDEESLTLRVTDTYTLSATVRPSNATHPEVTWSSSNTSAVTVDQDGNLAALSIGTSTITATAGGKTDTCQVDVLPDATFTFFLRMDFCADEADFGSSGYDADDLREGITLTSQGHDAGAALETVLNSVGIPCSFYSGDSGSEALMYWVDDIFGLGDVYYDNGLWRYWIQFHDGVYNDLTLGYYKDGGNFSLIYGMTEESGAMVQPARIPEAGRLVYTGISQTGVEQSDAYVVIGGTAKDAGSYSATLVLNDGYAWEDCTFDNKSVAWSISPATLVATYVSESIPAGSSPALQVGVTGFVYGETASTASGYVAPSVSAECLSAGSYMLVPSGGSASNYTFSYAPGMLVIGSQAAVGDTFVVSGLVYKVTSVLPLEVSLIGYEECPARLHVPFSVRFSDMSFIVKSIGEKAFFNCGDVESVVVDGASVGLKAFANCTSLTSVRIGSNPGGYSFSGCTALKSVVISEGVSSVGTSAFSGCTALESLSVASSVASFGNNAFYGLKFYDGASQIFVDSLPGHDFEGSGKSLYKVALSVGDTVVKNGLVYAVTSLEPRAASLVGYETAPSSLVVPETVSFGGIPVPVTSIGKEAFKNCTTITKADLGGVSTVGMKAFASCTKLKTVDVGESLKTLSAYAFYRCTKLASVNLEDSAGTLSAIGSYAFYKCTALTSIAVPSSVSTIGTTSPFPADMADEHGAVLGLSPDALSGYVYQKSGDRYVRQAGVQPDYVFTYGKLTYRVTSSLPAEVEVIGHDGSFRNITVPEYVDCSGIQCRVTAIGDSAFKDYSKIRTVAMPSVERIGSYAFYGCTYIAPVDADSVSSVGIKAFARCSGMKSIEFGEPLKTVGAYAFYGCKSLTSVAIPDSATTIGSYAFYKCTKLSEVSLGASLKTIGSYAFAYTPIQEAILPSKVTSVGAKAFYECSELSRVEFESASATIGDSAFESCPLETAVMPEAVKKLGSGAFQGIVFRSAAGGTLPHSASALAGKALSGSDGVLWEI